MSANPNDPSSGRSRRVNAVTGPMSVGSEICVSKGSFPRRYCDTQRFQR